MSMNLLALVPPAGKMLPFTKSSQIPYNLYFFARSSFADPNLSFALDFLETCYTAKAAEPVLGAHWMRSVQSRNRR